MVIIEIISCAASIGISIWLGVKLLKLVTPMIKAITERNKAFTHAANAFADKCKEDEK